MDELDGLDVSFTLWVPDRRCVFEMWSHECVEQLFKRSDVPRFECSLECCEYGVGCVDASYRLCVCRKECELNR